MSLPRRLAPALLLAATAVLPLAYAQDCNPEDQVWDNVRPLIDLSTTSLINEAARTRPSRKPYLADVLQYQAVRKASGELAHFHAYLKLHLIHDLGSARLQQA